MSLVFPRRHVDIDSQQLPSCARSRHTIPTRSPIHKSVSEFQFEIFHEQLPLPVPCYDLLPVTELTLGPREAILRVLPAPLS